jgi:hypothetical protein
MFVQVIRGRVTSPEQVHAALDRWSGQLAAGAEGWLGSTAGVTGDGRFVALARFELVEADVTVDVPGDPDQAGFVQVMQGRASDLGRARELMAQNPDDWTAFRPDVIGSVTVGHEGGAYTLAFFFTSERAAREGESKQPPPRLKAQMEELNQLNIGEPEFLDLTQPWLYSP